MVIFRFGKGGGKFALGVGYGPQGIRVNYYMAFLTDRASSSLGATEVRLDFPFTVTQINVNCFSNTYDQGDTTLNFSNAGVNTIPVLVPFGTTGQFQASGAVAVLANSLISQRWTSGTATSGLAQFISVTFSMRTA